MEDPFIIFQQGRSGSKTGLKLTNRQERVVLQFMESTIEKVNTALAGLYAVEKILIEKKIISESALIERLKDARALPERMLGIATLKEMVEAYNQENNPSEKS